MKEYFIRYQRQIILEGFGIEAQKKLTNASVLVIGAGGLGCPIIQYLAASGVGHIGIADHDIISLSNLNRQILFGVDDIGKSKVDVSAKKIKIFNPEIKVSIFNKIWNQFLSLKHFPEFDIIIDATDNFASRYLINDGCVLMGKPLVFGAVSKFEGQVSVFNVAKNNLITNYRDLFPLPPKENEVMNCAEGGILGVLPGWIGVMQATETIKLITGIGNNLSNQLLTYDALQQRISKIDLIKNPDSEKLIPKDMESYIRMNYESLCQ